MERGAGPGEGERPGKDPVSGYERNGSRDVSYSLATVVRNTVPKA